MSAELNLDRLAAETAQRILGVRGQEVKGRKVAAKDIGKLATDALGVLQEQGVYALVLFLLSRSGGKTAPAEMDAPSVVACGITFHLLALLGQVPFLGLDEYLQVKPDGTIEDAMAMVNRGAKEGKGSSGKESILAFVSEQVSGNLQGLLTVKRLFEQVLVYARYGAKGFSTTDAGEEEAAEAGA